MIWYLPFFTISALAKTRALTVSFWLVTYYFARLIFIFVNIDWTPGLTKIKSKGFSYFYLLGFVVLNKKTILSTCNVVIRQVLLLESRQSVFISICYHNTNQSYVQYNYNISVRRGVLHCIIHTALHHPQQFLVGDLQKCSQVPGSSQIDIIIILKISETRRKG